MLSSTSGPLRVLLSLPNKKTTSQASTKIKLQTNNMTDKDEEKHPAPSSPTPNTQLFTITVEDTSLKSTVTIEHKEDPHSPIARLLITLPDHPDLNKLKRVLYKLIPIIYKNTFWQTPEDVQDKLALFTRVATLLSIADGNQTLASIDLLLAIHQIRKSSNYNFFCSELTLSFLLPDNMADSAFTEKPNQLSFVTHFSHNKANTTNLCTNPHFILALKKWLENLLKTPRFEDAKYQYQPLALGQNRPPLKAEQEKLNNEYQTYVKDKPCDTCFAEVKEEMINSIPALCKKLDELDTDGSELDVISKLQEYLTSYKGYDANSSWDDITNATYTLVLRLFDNPTEDPKHNPLETPFYEYLKKCFFLLHFAHTEHAGIFPDEYTALFLTRVLLPRKPIRIRVCYFYEEVLEQLDETISHRHTDFLNFFFCYSLRNENEPDSLTTATKKMKQKIAALLFEPLILGQLNLDEAFAIIDHLTLAHLPSIQLQLATVAYYRCMYDATAYDKSESANIRMATQYTNCLSSLFRQKHSNDLLPYIEKYFTSRISAEKMKKRIGGFDLPSTWFANIQGDDETAKDARREAYYNSRHW